MDITDVMEKRYSCRSFDPDRPVQKAVLEAILEAGRLAPTAKNLQEQRVYVIQSDEGLRKVDSITPCRYGAPAVIAVAYDRNNVFVYPGGKRDSGAEDATIVATHMMLAAAGQCVDSCWINFFDPEKAAEALGLPENEKLVMLLDLGYASGEHEPGQKKRKALEEIVSYC